MLNKELSHFAENNKSGAQISDYLYSTYTGKLPCCFSSDILYCCFPLLMLRQERAWCRSITRSSNRWLDNDNIEIDYWFIYAIRDSDGSNHRSSTSNYPQPFQFRTRAWRRNSTCGRVTFAIESYQWLGSRYISYRRLEWSTPANDNYLSDLPGASTTQNLCDRTSNVNLLLAHTWRSLSTSSLS